MCRSDVAGVKDSAAASVEDRWGQPCPINWLRAVVGCSCCAVLELSSPSAITEALAEKQEFRLAGCLAKTVLELPLKFGERGRGVTKDLVCYDDDTGWVLQLCSFDAPDTERNRGGAGGDARVPVGGGSCQDGWQGSPQVWRAAPRRVERNEAVGRGGLLCHGCVDILDVCCGGLGWSSGRWAGKDCK